MAQLRPSGIPLFKIFGIQVSLHWLWLLVAYWEVQRRSDYSSVVWPLMEYLLLFGIVLLHEFGHALACRSVGGRADQIMLWPLGGVAFVQPPPRPGAQLWSIIAGPLVNVILVPITIGIYMLYQSAGASNPDLEHLLYMISAINIVLLVFNMLPIYPLDGGQVLRSLLWFALGQGRSLMVASIIGLAGAAVGVVLALLSQNWWLVIMALFAAMQSWMGFQRSKAMRLMDDAPHRQGVRCPKCGTPPPVGALWTCPCGQSFDTFETQARCPRCGGVFMTTTCPTCRTPSPPLAWYPPAFPVQPVSPQPPPPLPTPNA